MTESRRSNRCSNAALAALVAGFAVAVAAPIRARDLGVARVEPAPVGTGSLTPNMVSSPGGLYVSWQVRSGGTETKPRHALQFAVLSEDGWSGARRIAEGTEWFVNWADVPVVAPVGRGVVAASWLERSGDDPYAYDVSLTVGSDRDGWSAPSRPHDDGTKTEHGFVSMAPVAGDRLLLAWLDGRATADSGGAMSLRAAFVSPLGRVTDQVRLDSRTCDCCPTAAVAVGDGAVVVYRDRSPEETRDVSIVRWGGGVWSAPARVFDDGWKIPGCPVNGPAVDASGDSVVVAWFTAAAGKTSVKVAVSYDGGASFGPPVRVDDNSPIGRVDVSWIPGGGAAVSWLAFSNDRGELRIRRISGDGRRGPSAVVARVDASRRSGVPRLARWNGQLYAAWTESGDVSRVRVARLAW